jgi:hypothetical protein
MTEERDEIGAEGGVGSLNEGCKDEGMRMARKILGPLIDQSVPTNLLRRHPPE